MMFIEEFKVLILYYKIQFNLDFNGYLFRLIRVWEKQIYSLHKRITYIDKISSNILVNIQLSLPLLKTVWMVPDLLLSVNGPLQFRSFGSDPAT